MKQKSHWFRDINFNESNCVICLGDFSTKTGKATVVTKAIPIFRGDTLLQDHLERQQLYIIFDLKRYY